MTSTKHPKGYFLKNRILQKFLSELMILPRLEPNKTLHFSYLQNSYFEEDHITLLEQQNDTKKLFHVKTFLLTP